MEALLELKKTKSSEIKGFAVDSRKVLPGFVYFALQGVKVDGHDFVEEAFQRGAYVAIVSKAGNYSGKTILVKDVRETLQMLANQKRKELDCIVIGITGSVGKTTTKEFLATLLASKFKVEKTPGSANSQVGLPLYILNELKPCDIAIFEMGMSYAEEMKRLTQMAMPSHVLITKIAPAHIGNFPSLEELANAKGDILKSPEISYALLPKFIRSNSHVAEILNGKDVEVEYFGSDCNLKYIDTGKGIQIFDVEIELPFEALHLKENFFLAALIARKMGVSFEEIQKSAKSLKPFSKRFESKHINGIHFIDDSFNGSPTSMEAALNNLPKPMGGGSKIVAIGRMGDLGDQEEFFHEKIARIAEKNADVVFLYGEPFLKIKHKLKKVGITTLFFSNFANLKKELLSVVKEGDVVLIKGSNSDKFWTLLE